MSWVIVKMVCGSKYYWNETERQWEGLQDNATKYGTSLDAVKGGKNTDSDYIEPIKKS